MIIATYQVRWRLEDGLPAKGREAAAAEYRTLPKLLDVTDADLASLGEGESLWVLLKKKTGYGLNTPHYWSGHCFYRQYHKGLYRPGAGNA